MSYLQNKGLPSNFPGKLNKYRGLNKESGADRSKYHTPLQIMREGPPSIKYLIPNVELTHFAKSLTIIIAYDKFAGPKTKQSEQDQNKTM